MESRRSHRLTWVWITAFSSLLVLFFLSFFHIKRTSRCEEKIKIGVDLIDQNSKGKLAYWPLFVLPRYQEYLPYERVRTSFPRPRCHSRRYQRWCWTPLPLRCGIPPRPFPAHSDVPPVCAMASRKRRISVDTLHARDCRNCIWKDYNGQKMPPEDLHRLPRDCEHAGPMAIGLLRKSVWA